MYNCITVPTTQPQGPPKSPAVVLPGLQVLLLILRILHDPLYYNTVIPRV